jgi:hypothetical protein
MLGDTSSQRNLTIGLRWPHSGRTAALNIGMRLQRMCSQISTDQGLNQSRHPNAQDVDDTGREP